MLALDWKYNYILSSSTYKLAEYKILCDFIILIVLVTQCHVYAAKNVHKSKRGFYKSTVGLTPKGYNQLPKSNDTEPKSA